jgi:hypothetical protein
MEEDQIQPTRTITRGGVIPAPTLEEAVKETLEEVGTSKTKEIINGASVSTEEATEGLRMGTILPQNNHSTSVTPKEIEELLEPVETIEDEIEANQLGTLANEDVVVKEVAEHPISEVTSTQWSKPFPCFKNGKMTVISKIDNVKHEVEAPTEEQAKVLMLSVLSVDYDTSNLML